MLPRISEKCGFGENLIFLIKNKWFKNHREGAKVTADQNSSMR
jgi:hypothetical protein